MSHNKPYTQGYFLKRLRDSQIDYLKIPIVYKEDDGRYWSIIASPNKKNIFVHCYKTKNDFYFCLMTDVYKQYRIETQSVATVINILSSLVNPETISTSEFSK